MTPFIASSPPVDTTNRTSTPLDSLVSTERKNTPANAADLPQSTPAHVAATDENKPYQLVAGAVPVDDVQSPLLANSQAAALPSIGNYFDATPSDVSPFSQLHFPGGPPAPSFVEPQLAHG
jgi:hypothetical protein